MNWTICLVFQLQRSTRSTGFCLACHCVDKIQQTLDTWRQLRLRSWFGPTCRHSLQHSLPNSVQSKQIPAFPQGEKELDHTSNSPTFLQAAQSTGFCLTCLRARGGLTHTRCLGATEKKTVVQTGMQGLAIPHPPSSARNKQWQNPRPQLLSPWGGQHLEHMSNISNFFRDCQRNWLLSPLCQSADEIYHAIDASDVLRTKMVVWTNTKV